jgi:hypothetical protein
MENIDLRSTPSLLLVVFIDDVMGDDVVDEDEDEGDDEDMYVIVPLIVAVLVLV